MTPLSNFEKELNIYRDYDLLNHIKKCISFKNDSKKILKIEQSFHSFLNCY